jgi:hypothetical protein
MSGLLTVSLMLFVPFLVGALGGVEFGYPLMTACFSF